MIADLRKEIIREGPSLETTYHTFETMEDPENNSGSKEQESIDHKRWVPTINEQTIRLNTDGSKNKHGLTNSA